MGQRGAHVGQAGGVRGAFVDVLDEDAPLCDLELLALLRGPVVEVSSS